MTQFARSLDGRRLAWSRDGTRGGQPILFCNSIGTDKSLWDPQIPSLSQNFEVIRFDMRGHGASDAPVGAYRLKTLAQDAVAVLDAAGIDRAHVCGLSLGGAVAMRLALDFPNRVDRLIVANSAAKIGSAEVWQSRMDVVLSQGLEAIADMAMSRFFDAAFRLANPDVVDRFRAMLLRNPAVGYAGCCAALRDADLRPEISFIGAPMLLIAGRLDVSTPPSDLRAIADAVPSTRVLELAAAHLSNVEAPEAFTSAIVDFFGN